MPTGISGSTIVIEPLIDGIPALNFVAIEQRVLSNLFQSLMAGNGQIDELNVLRNDQAFELGLPTPIPGSNL